MPRPTRNLLDMPPRFLITLGLVTCAVGCVVRPGLNSHDGQIADVPPYGTEVSHSLAAALDHFAQNEYRAAIAACDARIAANPDDAHAFLLRSVARFVTDDIAGGVADADEAFRLNPAYWITREDDRNAPRAIDGLRPGEQSNRLIAGSTAPARSDRVFAYYESIVRGLDNVSILRPRYADAFAARGRAYERDGNWPGAIRCCTEAIRLNPQLPRAYLCRGNALSAQGRESAARDDLNRAVALQPLLGVMVTDQHCSSSAP